MTIAERRTCRICGSSELEEVLDLGPQHLASRFPLPDSLNEESGPYPLVLVRCSSGEGCGLVQLKHTVDPLLMYSQYGYLSGINESMQEHLQSVVRIAESWVDLSSAGIVVDIGCNDGTLLNSYSLGNQLTRIGFEPAANAAHFARESGIHVEESFFEDEKSVALLGGKRADVVTSIAMFYDLEQPQTFVDAIAKILSPNGVWIVEMSYLPLMLQKKSLDTICHEHLEYYAMRQLDWMVARSGMRVLDAHLNSVNGGSIQLIVGHDEYWSGQALDTSNVDFLRAEEGRMDLDSARPHDTFRVQCEKLRAALLDVLEGHAQKGRLIAGYGASTKGNTLLQYCEIGSDTISFLADRNPWKEGRVTPGTNIPIVGEDHFRSQAPDLALVLPWHFIDGFVTREGAYLDGGGAFLVPLPEIRLIRGTDIDP